VSGLDPARIAAGGAMSIGALLAAAARRVTATSCEAVLMHERPSLKARR